MPNKHYRKYYYIYLTTNKINGKNYIGKHYGKLNDSYLGSGFLLQKAIEKYGKKNFNKIILAICNSEEISYILEVEYIAIYRSIGKAEYNILSGGKGGDSEVTKNQWKNSEIRNKHYANRNKYWNSPEGLKQKQINSEKQKGHKNTKGKHWFNNGIQNIVADNCPVGFIPGRLGNFTQSEETKQKRREFEKNMTEEQKKAKSEKLSKILKGHIVTEETRANISKANKGRRYYNNGVIEVMRFECPEGFVPGRVLRHK